ncbi:uncharacterized protein BCR38DRAFT_404840 [Pseudomassariella vexata]|uniref:F-box domain-containing protein n=1 Tax=Pseudomassariella vexata TaxID=1141098 RepID=A0A1Y2EJS9_9PEZI|nr:uncharacterized protein BCR38DRAFT_404840 [Pseudomassariella vexata]ORY71801.1 hypothetical protein BCR38DRAFT_404840 [Pseudomassariella vexata]
MANQLDICDFSAESGSDTEIDIPSYASTPTEFTRILLSRDTTEPSQTSSHTSTTETSTETQFTQFLNLPIGIRQIIYSHLLAFPSNLINFPICAYPHVHPKYLFPQILIANRQIHTEALPILCQTNKFVVDTVVPVLLRPIMTKWLTGAEEVVLHLWDSRDNPVRNRLALGAFEDVRGVREGMRKYLCWLERSMKAPVGSLVGLGWAPSGDDDDDGDYWEFTNELCDNFGGIN